MIILTVSKLLITAEDTENGYMGREQDPTIKLMTLRTAGQNKISNAFTGQEHISAAITRDTE